MAGLFQPCLSLKSAAVFPTCLPSVDPVGTEDHQTETPPGRPDAQLLSSPGCPEPPAVPEKPQLAAAGGKTGAHTQEAVTHSVAFSSRHSSAALASCLANALLVKLRMILLLLFCSKAHH